MEGIEEVLQNHSRKIEGLENQMTKIVKKVEMLGMKDQDILGEIGKLELQVRIAGKSKEWKETTSIKNSLATKEMEFKSTQATLKLGIEKI